MIVKNRRRFTGSVRSILVVAFNRSIADDVDLKFRTANRTLPPRTKFNDDICREIMKRTNNVRVGALAGSGKTTQIEHSARHDFPGAKVIVKTIHGCGYSALQYHLRKQGLLGSNQKLEVDEHKVSDILTGMLGIDGMEEGAKKDRALAIKGAAKHLVSLMKAWAFSAIKGEATDDDLDSLCDHYEVEMPEGVESAEVYGIARAALEANNRNVTVIDFDDQVYLPLVLKVSFFTNDLIFVDECQDLNPARYYLIQRMATSSYGDAQVVFVGDENQAIYGFTGADSNAMTTISEMFSTTNLPLSICWRCSKAVIREAQAIVPEIQAAPNALEGSVNHLGSWDEMLATIQAGDFVLCRTTAPLVDLCMHLIRQGRAATVRGRDIGQGLIALAAKIAKRRGMKKKGMTLAENLYTYREEALAKLDHPKKANQRQSMADRLDTLIVLSEECKDFDDLKKKIEKIFTDSAGSKNLILCSTAHKAKGLEAKNVYIIHPELMPFPFARQEWQQKQEKNLKYVAITRAQENLYWVHDENRNKLKKAEETA